MARFRVVGISFDHSHMGDNLKMADEHPDCEIVGVCSEQPEQMARAVQDFDLSSNQVFSDYRQCMEHACPDLVLLCPATARHGEWVARVAPYGKLILLEKPFAATLAEADAMIDACHQHGATLAVNWPLAWYPSHRTAKRLLDEGRIGEVVEVHYYDGNRGPLWHTAGKEQQDADAVACGKPTSWFYKKEAGGGSLLDYLGYGVTLGTWFHGGAKPLEVTAVTGGPLELEVDEQSVTIARYASGLSTFQTRWGTFTDPWTQQPQPKCGFVLVGKDGTISSYDFEPAVRIQTRACSAGWDEPVDRLEPPYQNPVQYVLHCIDGGLPIEGPLSTRISRIGQQIVEAAMRSAEEKRAVALAER